MEFLKETKKSNPSWIKKYPVFLVGAIYLLLILIVLIPNLPSLNDSIIGTSDAVQVYGGQLERVNTFFEGNQTEKVIGIARDVFSKKIFSHATHLKYFGIILGEELGFNIYWILSFVLSGIGMFLLIRYLIKNNYAAFLAGLIFAFSPTHFAYAQGYGGTMHIEWTVFFVLFLVLYLDKLKIKYLVGVGIFYAFLFFNEPHFAVYFAIFSLAYFIYKLFYDRDIYKKIGRKTIIVAMIILIIAFGYFIYAYSSGSNLLKADFNQVIEFSNDTLAIVTPPVFHEIWGESIWPFVEENYTGNSAENTIYLGLIIGLLILSTLINRKKIKHFNFWLWSGIGFFILSLGPFLHFKGLVEPMVPMPYLLFYHYFPFFDNIRSIGRLFAVAILCFSVLAGFGATYLFAWTKTKVKKINYKKVVILITLVVSTLILFDYFPEIKTSKIEIPEFYYELNNESGDFAILQPLITTSYKFASELRIYNGVHDKDVFGGEYFNNFVRKDAEKNEHKTETPVINNLLYSLPLGLEYTDIIDYDYQTLANYYLNQNNIKYIILHKDFISIDNLNHEANYMLQKDYDTMVSFIDVNVFNDKIIDDEKLLVYEVRQENQQPIILTVGENTYPNWVGNYWWENEKNYSSQPGRWFGTDSTLVVNNLSNEYKDILIKTEKFSTSEEAMLVSIYLNNKFIKEVPILSNSLYGQKIVLEQITPGENIVKFEIKDKDKNIVEITKKNKKEGIYIAGVSYSENNILDVEDIILSELLEIPSQRFDQIIYNNLDEWYLNFDNIFNAKIYYENGISKLEFNKDYLTTKNLNKIYRLFKDNISVQGKVKEDDNQVTYAVTSNVIYQCLKDSQADYIYMHDIYDWYKYFINYEGEYIFAKEDKVSVLEQRFNSCYEDFEINGQLTPHDWTGGEIRFYLEGLDVNIKMYNGNKLILKIDGIEETISQKLSIGSLVNIKFIRRGDNLQFYENDDLIFEKQIENEKVLERFKFSLISYPEKEISLKLGQFNIKPIYE